MRKLNFSLKNGSGLIFVVLDLLAEIWSVVIDESLKDFLFFDLGVSVACTNSSNLPLLPSF